MPPLRHPAGARSSRRRTPFTLPPDGRVERYGVAVSDLQAFDLRPHLDDVTELVRQASVLSLQWYRTGDRVDNKSVTGFDPVTEADRAVETALREGLAARFPDHAILGEEFGLTGDGPIRWTIDPVDGTRAFITGQPMWGTLLGLSVAGSPIAGWMHLPVLNETYIGARDIDGCHLVTADGSDNNISVSATEELADAIVLCTHPEMFAPGPQAQAFARVADAVKMVRYAGDCLNYGLLSMGLADSVIENGLADYDIVPLIPIVESAGGVVTDLDGRSPLSGGYVVASATRALHEATLAVLNS